MSETKNYKLYVTNDSSEKFQNVREHVYGETDSNMTKIDEILSDKSDKSVNVMCTLAANSWSGVDSPFTQELAVAGLGATQNGDISIAQSATFEQREVAREAKLCVTGQTEGKLTISADGEMPGIDIPVVVTLLG